MRDYETEVLALVSGPDYKPITPGSVFSDDLLLEAGLLP